MWTIARGAGIRLHDTNPLSPEMEAKAIELARKGHGQPYIARVLAVPGHRVCSVLQRFVLARTGSREPRARLSELEERSVRTKFRSFEEQMAVEYAVEVQVIQRLLQRRK